MLNESSLRYKEVARILCIISTIFFLVSCGSKTSSQAAQSIDGRYVYQDAVSRSVITISGDHWSMKTQFGAPGYYGNDAKYDSGSVQGNTLYYTASIPYGKVSGRTVTIGSRRYHKE